MDFTAIDFETASQRRDSACQLAAVVVRQGEIVRQAKWLIRPRPLFFAPGNIRIHGITPDHVRDQPEFGELWPEIAETFAGDCLVAHNATFDLGVLLACLRSHGHPVPDLEFTCTRAIARRAWPGRRSYGLKPLSNWLGVRFRHHDALEDAIACAKVMLAARVAKQAGSLEQLEQTLRLSRGRAGQWGCRGPGGGRRRRPSGSNGSGSRATTSRTRPVEVASVPESARREPDAGIDLQRLLVRAEFIRPLAGQRIVFTGCLRHFSRESAEELARRLGGQCDPCVTRHTNLVVVGRPDARTLAAGRRQSVKESRAAELCRQGAAIRILEEDDFLSLIVHPNM